MVPREALIRSRGDECAGVRSQTRGRSPARREEEPVRVSKRCEGRCAERIGCDHVQRLHPCMVRKRNHNIVLDRSCVRVQPAQLAHLPFKVANNRIILVPNRLSTRTIDIHGGRVIGVN